MNRRKKDETPVERAIKFFANPRDKGYTQERAVQVEKKNSQQQGSPLTMSVVMRKFEAFALEFREFSNPHATKAVREFAQEQDTGIGPISYKHRRKNKRIVDLTPAHQHRYLRAIAIAALREKNIGDRMVRIVAYNSYYLRIPGKETFLTHLSRVAIRGLLAE